VGFESHNGFLRFDPDRLTQLPASSLKPVHAPGKVLQPLAYAHELNHAFTTYEAGQSN
jgi:hypothetical protein